MSSVQDSVLVTLANLADRQRSAERDVEKLEKAWKDSKERLREINEDQIPDLMDSINIETYTTKTGLKITVKENLRASIPVAVRPQALQWLRDNGHEKLIKHVMEVQPNSDEDAETLTDIFKGNKVPFTDKSSVNHMTLSKFCREKLEAGERVPEDLFGVYRQRQSKIEETHDENN